MKLARNAVFIALIIAGYTGISFAETDAGAKKIFELVLADKDAELPREAATGCAGWRSAGEYLAFLLGTLAEAETGDRTGLRLSCIPANSSGKRPPLLMPRELKAPSAYDCVAIAEVVDAAGESPWHYGLQFALDAKKERIVPGTFLCPGLP